MRTAGLQKHKLENVLCAIQHKEGGCPVFLAADFNQRWGLVQSKGGGAVFGVGNDGISALPMQLVCEKSHHKLPHATPPSAGQTSERTDIHRGKAEVNASSSSQSRPKNRCFTLC